MIAAASLVQESQHCQAAVGNMLMLAQMVHHINRVLGVQPGNNQAFVHIACCTRAGSASAGVQQACQHLNATSETAQSSLGPRH